MSVHGSKLGKPHEALERMMQSIFDCRRNGTEGSCCRQGWGGQERTESCPSAALLECKAGPSRRRGSPQSAASARTARKPAGRGSCTRLESRCVQRNRCFPNRRLRMRPCPACLRSLPRAGMLPYTPSGVPPSQACIGRVRASHPGPDSAAARLRRHLYLSQNIRVFKH